MIMSLSYKKHHIYKYFGSWGYLMKKYSNRRLRRKKLTHNYRHNSYRKDTNPWDICDNRCYYDSFESYYQSQMRLWRSWQNYSWGRSYDKPDRRKEYKTWLRFYKRK